MFWDKSSWNTPHSFEITFFIATKHYIPCYMWQKFVTILFGYLIQQSAPNVAKNLAALIIQTWQSKKLLLRYKVQSLVIFFLLGCCQWYIDVMLHILRKKGCLN